MRRALYRPEFNRTLAGFDADSHRHAWVSDRQHLPLLSQLQSLDISGYLSGGILVKVDRLSMKESLEVRCPLLDHRIFEFMSQISPELKMNSSGSKWLFQKALKDILPSEVLQRRKRGFDVPLVRWLSGPLIPLVDELRSASSLAIHRWLEPSAVARCLSSQPPFALSQASRLWALVCLELWARSWFAAGRS
jgi:asparagine synthase (glutamine-hydrolysing)